MKIKSASIIICLILLQYGISAAEDIHDTIIDDYNCYLECCSGREFVSLESTEIFEKPNINSKILYTLPKNETINCYEGNLHKTPVRFIVQKKFGKYLPGDTLWVLGYLEEGIWEIWENDRIIEVNLGFDPLNESNGTRCERSELCNGVLEKEPIQDFWLKVKTKDGIVGWSKETNNFKLN